MQYCQGMSQLRATSTSYAVLGLLAVRPWTAYELAQQADRSLRFFFPRAERAVYLEAKRLVDLGWARPEKVLTGRRSSTRYHITEAGRRALRSWTAEPSAAPRVESEAVLKLFIGDRSDLSELRTTIKQTADQAIQSLQELADMAAGDLHGAAFPDRVDINVLSMVFMSDMQRAVLRWAEWAEHAVNTLQGPDPAAKQQQTTQALLQIANWRDEQRPEQNPGSGSGVNPVTAVRASPDTAD